MNFALFQLATQIFIISLGNLIVGYTTTYFALTQNAVALVMDYKNSENKDLIDGIINALLPVGAAIGGSVSNYFVKALMYRKTFIFLDIIGIVSVFISFIPNLYVLGVVRFVYGFFVGVNSSITIVYVCQLIPQKYSGFFAGMPVTIMMFGLTLGFIIQWIVLIESPEDVYNPHESYGVIGFSGWRIVFGIPLIFFMMRLFCYIFVYQLNLPSEYLEKGQKDQAIRVLENQYELETQKINKNEFVNFKLTQLQGMNTEEKISYKELLSPRYLKMFLVCCILGLSQQITGINAVNYYASVIISEMTTNYTLLNLANVLIGLFSTLTSFLSGIFITKYGRKPILLIGLSCCLACLSYLTISLIFKDSDNEDLKLSSLIFLLFFVISYGMSLGPLFWVYSSEVLPQKAQDFTVFLLWIGCAIVVQLFPIVSNNLGMFYNFGFYALICLFTIIVVYKYLIESKGLNKIEILNQYQIKNHQSIQPNDQNEEDQLQSSEPQELQEPQKAQDPLPTEDQQ